MTIGDIVTPIIALSGMAAVYYQARSVRVSEEHLRSQVKGLQEFVDRIKREKEERETQVRAESLARAEGLKEVLEESRLHSDRRFVEQGMEQAVVSDILSSISLSIFYLANDRLSQRGQPREGRDLEAFHRLKEMCRSIVVFEDLNIQYQREIRTAADSGGNAAVDDVKARLLPPIGKAAKAYRVATEQWVGSLGVQEASE